MAILLFFGLTSCAHERDINTLVSDYDLSRDAIQVRQFELLTLANSGAEKPGVLHIYLGGDGKPWGAENLSVNPTGANSLTVALMAQNPGPSVYLGRPCYHLSYMQEHCEPQIVDLGAIL